MKRRNNKGQFTKDMSILITKELQRIADDVSVRVRPLVRDELDRSYRANLYASYRPVSASGKAVKEYNETHKHQKACPYHHTGILARSVKTLIDGNTVKAVIKDKEYPDGTSTVKVYNYLKYGTTKTPKSDTYPYENKGKIKFAPYIPTEKHDFEDRTLEEMEDFLDRLATDLKNDPKYYGIKYGKKGMWKGVK